MPRPRRSQPDPLIGQLIRRQRLLRGLSLRRAADQAGISHTELSRIEQGKVPIDNRFLLADLAQALSCSVEELIGAPSQVPDLEAQQARGHAQSLRAALIETDLTYPASRPAREPQALAADLEMLRYTLFSRWDYAASGERMPALLRDLHATAAAGVDRPAMLQMMVEVCGAAHTWAVDFGTQADCWLAAERAGQAAEALEDPVMIGFSGWLRALACTSGGLYAPALMICGREVDALAGHPDEPDALIMRGLLQLTAGFSAYGLRRPVDGAAWMGEGAEVAQRLGVEQATIRDIRITIFGPTNTGIWRVAAGADGDDPAEALRWAEQVDLRRLNEPGRHATFYRDTARALAHSGTRDADRRAVRYLLSAEKLVPTWLRTSPAAQETARGLRNRLPGGREASAVRGLCERMGLAA